MSIWHDINIALSPVIGQQGVAALYKRSLSLTRSDYPCLAFVHEHTLEPGDFSVLQMALSRQNGTDAVATNSALLRTFHERLACLIGKSLTEQLLQFVWHDPSSPAIRQDFI
nr:hypothetical protein [uncultured Halomonas sp.]